MPDELLENGSLRSGLTAFKGTELSFVGISEPFTVADGDETPHALTVLIPKSTYDRIVLKSVAEIAAVLMLLVFFAVGCCLLYTRRYFRPILEDLVHVTAAAANRESPSLKNCCPSPRSSDPTRRL